MSLPPNFSFIWKKHLAGSAYPGRGGELMENLQGLRGAGIEAILSLTEDPLDFAPIRESNFAYAHIPIDDFTAPSPTQIDEAVDFIQQQVDEGHGVLVHCQAGIGRTGTLLACYLVSQGINAKEAIQTVRDRRPMSLEVYSQEYAVYQYEQRRQQKDADTEEENG